MRKSFSFALGAAVLSLGLLSACESNPPDDVTTTITSEVPAPPSGSGAVPAPPASEPGMGTGAPANP